MNIRIRSLHIKPVDKSAVTEHYYGTMISTLDQLANKIEVIL